MSSPSTGAPRSSSPWAVGATVFAGILLVCNGTISILEGITGIAKDDVLVSTPRYVYRFDLTTWGWLHLAIGVVLVIVGIGVLRNQGWARWTGILLAGVSLFTQFMFLPHYPLWSLTVMALDVFIIWGLATVRSDERI